MIFERLELENFLSHRHTVLDFSEQFNLFVGENGSGKSAILEGVAFALFGLNLRTRSQRDLIRYGADSLRVALTFRHHNTAVKIHRSLSATKTTAIAEWYRISAGDRVFRNKIEGAVAIKDEMKNLLQMDEAAFQNMCFAAQGEMEALLEAKPADRKVALDRLLGIDLMEKIALWMYREFLAAEEKYLSQRQNDLQRNWVEWREKQEDLKKRIQEVRVERKRWEKEYKEIQHQLAGMQKLWHQWEEKRRKYESLLAVMKEQKRHLHGLEEQRKNVEKRLSELRQLKQKCEGFKGSIEAWQRLQKQIEELVQFQHTHQNRWQEVSQKKTALQLLEKEKNKWQKEWKVETFQQLLELRKRAEEGIQRGKTILDRLQDEISGISNRRGGIQQKRGHLQTLVQALQNEESAQCPICGAPLTQEHRSRLLMQWKKEEQAMRKELASLNSEEKGLKEKMARARKDFDLANSRLTQTSDRVKQWQEKEIQKRQLQEWLYEQKPFMDEWKSMEEKRQELERVREVLQPQVMQYQKALGEVQQEQEREKERKEILRNISEDNERIKRTEEEMKQLRYSPEEYERLAVEKERLEKAEREIHGWGQRLKERESSLREMEESLHQEKRKLEQQEEELQKREKRLGELQMLRKAFSADGVPSLMRSAFFQVFGQKLNEYFSRFRLNFSNVQVFPAEDGDLVLHLIQPDGTVLDWRQLSGGEKMSLALAVRLAIAGVRTGEPIQSILLDEPTIFLDAERRIGMMEALRTAGEFLQLIVVSHDEEIGEVISAAGGKLFRVQKKQNISVVNLE